MSDTKILNNQIETLNVRLDYVERQRLELAEALAAMTSKYEHAYGQANYFRRECRLLADSGNAARGIQETLTRRLEAHRRDLIPGDDLHQAAVIECQTVLAIVNDIIGGQ